MKHYLWIALLCCLSACSKSSTDSREQVREIAWAGRSLDTASYWVNRKPVGMGMKGFEAVTKMLNGTDDESRISIRGFLPDVAALSEEYPNQSSLPFADNPDESIKFNMFAAKKRLTFVSHPFENLKELPPQKK